MVDVSVPRLGLTKRTLPRTREEDAQQALGRFVRVETWNGLIAGDVVRVAGHSARGRHWRFRAHVTNTSNGASWVEVSLVEGSPPSRRPGASPPPSPAPAGSLPGGSVAGSPAGGGSAADGSAADGSAADGAPEVVLRVERVRSFAPDLVTPRWRRRARQAQAQRDRDREAAAQQPLF